MKRPTAEPTSVQGFPKAATGISGLDAVTGGGLPRGRPTLVCGAAGCGKTLLAMEFLVRGASDLGEPGVFVSFEETAEELSKNFRSLGFDVDALVAREKLVVDHVQIDPAEIEETGEYDLEGLFIRLGSAIDTIGARRVVLDTLESLFASFRNEAIIRAELRRLCRWLKERGVTAIITAERGDRTMTRHGLEEYVSDCVILLDHRVQDQVASRRLRIVKYRGSSHGTNEYPFLIEPDGIELLPITSVGLDYDATSERVPTGVSELDEMLGGKGLFRGSAVLVSGTAGTGKTSVCAHVAEASCRKGERCLYFAFEESSAQIIRNMRSIGLDLRSWVRKGMLRFEAARPTLLGVEAHLTRIYRFVRDFDPRLVILDPISNLASAGTDLAAYALLMRLIDFFKSRQTTVLITNLAVAGTPLGDTEIGISSLIDTWIVLQDLEGEGERNRGMYILKSRGMAHSNQIREFLLTDQGVRLAPIYVAAGDVLRGSARVAREAEEKTAMGNRVRDLDRKRQKLALRRQEMKAELSARRRAFDAEASETDHLLQEAMRRMDKSREQLRLESSREGAPNWKARVGTGLSRARKAAREKPI